MEDFPITLPAMLNAQVVVYNSMSVCEVCGTSFQSTGTMTEKSDGSGTDNKKFSIYPTKACTPCTYSMVKGFLDHVPEPEPDPESQCSDCNTSFKSRKGLMQHIGKVHNLQRKAATCPECNKKFKHKYAVKFHVKQVHSKATRVNCGDCGKQFYNKYILKVHHDASHS